MVLDPDTLSVKWHTFDLTTEQDDPDFIGDDGIGIFDNNTDTTTQRRLLGGSRIVAIQPHTGAQRILYPTGDADPFYTTAGGKWQLLPNGNMLLKAHAGRPGGRARWHEHMWVNEP
jgi:hypothetical protein